MGKRKKRRLRFHKSQIDLIEKQKALKAAAEQKAKAEAKKKEKVAHAHELAAPEASKQKKTAPKKRTRRTQKK